MAREFLALVVRKALAQGSGIELSLAEKPAGAEARRILHLGKQHQAAGPLNQHANRGLIAGAFEEVTFPVTRRQAVFHFGRAHVDTDHVGIWPRRTVPRVRDIRVLWPWRKQAIKRRRNSPRG